MSVPPIVVIGASAGGLQALTGIVQQLTVSTRAAIFVVVHTRSEGNSYLAQILSRSSRLPAVCAEHGAPIEAGTIYVAPPNHHLLVMRNRIVLNTGPKENGFRPAVDSLFRTAARAYGSAVMGVVLSGALDDGAHGLKVIKDRGGVAVVQDPDEASHPTMPLSALRVVEADYVLAAADIGRLIATLSSTTAQGDAPVARRDEPEPQDPADETNVEEMEENFGSPSALTCPDCGGALWEIKNGALTHYRCHVGHQYTTEALDAEQQQVVEGALWSAVRVLEEHADLRRRMAERAGQHGMDVVSSGFTESARDAARQAHTIRELLFGQELPAPAPARATREPSKTKRTRAKRKRAR